MSEIMKYRSYQGSVEYCSDSGVYYGQILEVSALVNYESQSREGLDHAFEEAVESYLEIV